MDHITAINQEFCSVEAFSEALVSTPWEVEFSQLSRGASKVPVQIVQGDEAFWLRVTSSSRVHQRARPPRGHITVGIMDNPLATARLGSHELDWNSITLFNPDDAMDCVSTENFSAFTLSFPEALVLELAEQLGLDAPGETSRDFEAHHCVSERQMHSIRYLLREAGNVFSANNAMQQNAVMNSIERDFPHMLLQAWNDSSKECRAPASKRHKVLKRALAYIEAHPRKDISVATLCTESASSVSTLERAFREHFGVSPKQYLVSARLSGARRELLRAGDQRRIRDIATEWGFSHMSKFAQDYRRMFAERPSETRALAGSQVANVEG